MALMMLNTAAAHLLQRMITVVCLARATRRVYHHEVQHTIAAKLIEAPLPNSLLGVVCEGTEGTRTTPGAWLHYKCVVKKPSTTQQSAKHQMGRRGTVWAISSNRRATIACRVSRGVDKRNTTGSAGRLTLT